MMERLPYESSIDSLISTRPNFFQELHQGLFDDFKNQWDVALPNFPKEKLPDVIANMSKILNTPDQKAWHPWADWLINRIETEPTTVAPHPTEDNIDK